MRDGKRSRPEGARRWREEQSFYRMLCSSITLSGSLLSLIIYFVAMRLLNAEPTCNELSSSEK